MDVGWFDFVRAVVAVTRDEIAERVDLAARGFVPQDDCRDRAVLRDRGFTDLSQRSASERVRKLRRTRLPSITASACHELFLSRIATLSPVIEFTSVHAVFVAFSQTCRYMAVCWKRVAPGIVKAIAGAILFCGNLR
jgi:hypothetical protein